MLWSQKLIDSVYIFFSTDHLMSFFCLESSQVQRTSWVLLSPQNHSPLHSVILRECPCLPVLVTRNNWQKSLLVLVAHQSYQVSLRTNWFQKALGGCWLLQPTLEAIHYPQQLCPLCWVKIHVLIYSVIPANSIASCQQVITLAT